MPSARIAWLDAGDAPAAAERLCEALSLPRVTGPAHAFDLLLRSDRDGLSLLDPARPHLTPLRVDFTRPALQRRAGRGELLSRAVGWRAAAPPTVLDATAGLGRDAFLLATLGCHVQLFERHPVIHALLADGLRRAAQEPSLAAVAARMTLHAADARRALKHLPATVEVVYLDPMYAHRRRALPSREMQYFQALLTGPDEAGELLELALASPCRRVVVKRPRKGAPLAGRRPTHSLQGRSTRFDVYHIR